MEQKRVNHLEQIPPDGWGKTPSSVKKLVEEMAQQIEQQEKKLAEVLTAGRTHLNFMLTESGILEKNY